MKRLFLAVLGWFAAVGAASAADLPGDVSAGRDLAMQWCANCHLVAEGQQKPAIDGVPTFRAIANNPQTTEFWLRAFLQTPHSRMPNIQLTRRQTDDVISFILTQKRR
jgi:mono/diheme cytochrome c family protein